MVTLWVGTILATNKKFRLFGQDVRITERKALRQNSNHQDMAAGVESLCRFTRVPCWVPLSESTGSVLLAFKVGTLFSNFQVPFAQVGGRGIARSLPWVCLKIGPPQRKKRRWLIHWLLVKTTTKDAIKIDTPIFDPLDVIPMSDGYNVSGRIPLTAFWHVFPQQLKALVSQPR